MGEVQFQFAIFLVVFCVDFLLIAKKLNPKQFQDRVHMMREYDCFARRVAKSHPFFEKFWRVFSDFQDFSLPEKCLEKSLFFEKVAQKKDEFSIQEDFFKKKFQAHCQKKSHPRQSQ